MIIRDQQRQELAESLQRDFEDRMVIHLRTAFADEAKEWEEEDLRQLIRSGMDKAFGYGITIEADVSRFIEYALCYGEDFDADPQFRWAANVLSSDKLDGTEKMDSIDRLNYIALTNL